MCGFNFALSIGNQVWNTNWPRETDPRRKFMHSCKCVDQILLLSLLQVHSEEHTTSKQEVVICFFVYRRNDENILQCKKWVFEWNRRRKFYYILPTLSLEVWLNCPINTGTALLNVLYILTFRCIQWCKYTVKKYFLGKKKSWSLIV